MKSTIERMPSEALLNRCAEAWGLKNLTFVRKMENIVFSGESPEGKVFLRLTTLLRRSRAEIESEAAWIEHLYKSGLHVPKMIPNKAGDKVVAFTEGDQRYEVVVFSAIEGEHPSEETVTRASYLKKLGALIAKMHLATESYSHPSLKREEWYEERGIRHALEASLHSHESELREKLYKVVAHLKSLPRTPKTYGLIHADLGALNLFIGEDDSIGVIDFDDSCYHWFVFDLAIVVYSMTSRFKHTHIDPKEAEWLKTLLEGYQTVRPLSQEEIALIPTLMEFACLRLYFWINHHEMLGTFHETAQDKIAQIKQWAKDRLVALSK